MSILSTTGSASNLLDVLIDKMNLPNDAALGRRMGMSAPAISKLRNGKMEVGATFLINAHEETGLTIAELKEHAGLPPAKPYK